MQDVVTLRSGVAMSKVYPGLGGSLGSWCIGAQPMLRTADPADVAAGNPLGMASFPLVPYSNRIGLGRFEWAGRTEVVRPNFAPEPHAIHGLGWTRAWSVTAQTASSVTLGLETRPDADWPWPLIAQQRIVLEPERLVLYLSVVNQADAPVPLAFGHHPYFDAAGAVLQFSAERVWLCGPDGLPRKPVVPRGAFDFSAGAPVSGRSIDNCYDGVTDTARIDWADRALGLDITTSASLPAAVIYITTVGGAFCYEPVPHINNALNLVGDQPAMPVIAAGETFAATITFAARPSTLSV